MYCWVRVSVLLLKISNLRMYVCISANCTLAGTWHDLHYHSMQNLHSEMAVGHTSVSSVEVAVFQICLALPLPLGLEVI